MKIRIKLSQYSKLGVAKLILAIQSIIDALTGNVYFATPVPTLVILQSQLDTFASLASAVENGQLDKKDSRDLAKAELLLNLELLASYCLFTAQNTSDNIEQAIVKIQSAGLVVASKGENVGPLPAPSNARSKSLSNAIELEFDKIKGATFYIIMKTVGFPSENSVWTEMTSQRTKVVIPDCVPGQVMTFRVYGFGAAGLGEPSDYITDMARL